VLIIGFAGALDALGNLASSEFIALVAPLAALLAVALITRGTGDASSSRPTAGQDHAGPGPALTPPGPGSDPAHVQARVHDGGPGR